ncbi:MAG: acyl-CoA dehydrogenase family protein [Actinomycetota bacterium]|nr:acyl-CoA dehydrogenase family protein [Actinomycetota bacterium]
MNAKEIRSYARGKVFSSLTGRMEMGEFDRSLWREIADMGLLGMVIDKDYGGGGEDVREFSEGLGILAGESFDLGLTLSILDHVMLCAYPLQVFASRSLRERYLPSLCLGDRIGAAAISEPETSGDPSRMRTTARRDNNGYVLQGVKGPVTNAPVADVFMVVASTDSKAGKDGLSVFLVEKHEGVEVERVELDFLPTSPHGKVIMNDVWVPEDHLIGEEGWGHERFSRSVFLWERAVVIPIVISFMERWHHLVVSNLDAPGISPDIRFSLAQRKVELTAYSAVADRLLDLTFYAGQGSRERVELLLFFGKSLSNWVDSMRRLIEEANLPLDDNMSRMLRDLRLLEVGSSVLDWQFQRILL